jgi:type II/IV secretion system protein
MSELELVETARRMFGQYFLGRPDFTLLLHNGTLASAFKPSGGADDAAKAPDNPELWWERYCRAKCGLPPTGDKPTPKSLEFEESIVHDGDEVTARIQASRCFNAMAWSINVRWSPPQNWPEPSARPVDLATANSEWKPSSKLRFRRNPDDVTSMPFLIALSEIVKYLHDQIPTDEHGRREGLVLVTGATNSGKSEIARGLAWQCLTAVQSNPANNRTPHLVTCEGPIERYFWKRPALKLDAASWSNQPQTEIDYTPRQIRRDCDSLTQAFTDALRQTPTVFFAGELRGDHELRKALEFGGTGHVVIATAHAGSLIEAVSRTLTASAAKQADARAIYVPKLLAVIHLRRLMSTTTVTLGMKDSIRCEISALVPTLYRKTAAGLQTLVADGLAALLPHCPQVPRSDEGTLGRQFFLRSLNAEMPTPALQQPRSGDSMMERLIQYWNDVRAVNLKDEQKSGIVCDRPLTDLALEDDLYGR